MKELLDFKDVLILPQKSTVRSRAYVDLSVDYPDLYFYVPIMLSNMASTGTIAAAKVAQELGIFTILKRDIYEYDAEKAGLTNYATSIGIGDKYKVSHGVDSSPRFGGIYVNLDTANGYSEAVTDAVKRIKDSTPEIILIAGNVVTPEGVYDLAQAGADIVRVGIGNGQSCATREKTGIGYPQVSALQECAGVGVPIISDGGHATPGDAAKAFAAGASFVCVGTPFAAHYENWTESPHSPFQAYVTGNSDTENKEHYFDPRGPLRATLEDWLQGLRSACSYVGAHNLKEFYDKATLVRV